MALALIVLALGSVLAGYVGVPHALGGHNRIETCLAPSFHPSAAGGRARRGRRREALPAESPSAPHGEAAAAEHAATSIELDADGRVVGHRARSASASPRSSS